MPGEDLVAEYFYPTSHRLPQKIGASTHGLVKPPSLRAQPHLGDVNSLMVRTANALLASCTLGCLVTEEARLYFTPICQRHCYPSFLGRVTAKQASHTAVFSSAPRVPRKMLPSTSHRRCCCVTISSSQQESSSKLCPRKTSRNGGRRLRRRNGAVSPAPSTTQSLGMCRLARAS